MARSPVTRPQVDAYRFGLRRMDAALVRRDPVHLHEEIRGQRRTVAAGAVVAVVAVAAAAVYGLIVPKPVWQQQSLVVGRQSGALYVVARGPDRLVPVANLAAARLVMAAIGTQQPASGGPASPVPVDDADLASAPRTASAATPGAPSVLPGHGPGIPPRWAVCDETTTEPGRPTVLAGTTVVGGLTPQGSRLGTGQAVLLRGASGQAYLVHGGKRQRVELFDRRVTSAFDLGGRQPRPASDGLLAVIPEAPPLAAPRIAGAGQPAPGGLPGRVGGAVRVQRSGGADRYYAVLADGVQEVPQSLAELLGVAMPAARQDQLLALAAPRTPLDIADFPTGPLHLTEAADAATTCWAAAQVDGKQIAEVMVGNRPPTPEPLTATRLAQADGPGPRLDAAYVPAGRGGAVRATVPGQPPETGPLWLISDTGVAYGVPDAESAAALGVTTATAAPAAVVRLLPSGPPLELAAARRTLDVLDVRPG